jgi:hypothetical protein
MFRGYLETPPNPHPEFAGLMQDNPKNKGISRAVAGLLTAPPGPTEGLLFTPHRRDARRRIPVKGRYGASLSDLPSPSL